MENNDLLREQAKRLRQISHNTAPASDVSRSVVLTGSLVSLPLELCKYVTLMNTTGSSVSFQVNSPTSGTSAATISLPTGSGVTIETCETDNVKVSGSGTLSYIVSQ